MSGRTRTHYCETNEQTGKRRICTQKPVYWDHAFEPNTVVAATRREARILDALFINNGRNAS